MYKYYSLILLLGIEFSLKALEPLKEKTIRRYEWEDEVIYDAEYSSLLGKYYLSYGEGSNKAWATYLTKGPIRASLEAVLENNIIKQCNYRDPKLPWEISVDFRNCEKLKKYYKKMMQEYEAKKAAGTLPQTKKI